MDYNLVSTGIFLLHFFPDSLHKLQQQVLNCSDKCASRPTRPETSLTGLWSVLLQHLETTQTQMASCELKMSKVN